MTEIYDEPDIFADDYVETRFGKIHKSNIPYVTMEPNSFKVVKACLFYSVFVLAFAIIIHTIYLHSKSKMIDRKAKEMRLRKDAMGIKRIPTTIKMSRIKILNFNEPLPIEHIVLIDIYNNVVDIDVERNYFIERQKIGLEDRGELLDADLGSVMQVKEIIIFVDPEKLFSSDRSGLSIMLELYNFEDKVWSHFDLLREKENSIKIYYEVIEKLPDAIVRETIKDGNSREIIISNENTLAIKLREFEETYDGY